MPKAEQNIKLEFKADWISAACIFSFCKNRHHLALRHLAFIQIKMMGAVILRFQSLL